MIQTDMWTRLGATDWEQAFPGGNGRTASW
jgi:hypothetical protein